ncbi:MAG: hypothetical protein AB7G80_09150 [Dongiaceae bacterium]
MFNWLFGKKKATDEIKRRPRKGRKHGVTNMLILDVLKDYKAYHYDDIARKCNLKPSTVAPALWRLDLRPTVWALFYLKRKNRAQCIGNGFWQAVKVEAF